MEGAPLDPDARINKKIEKSADTKTEKKSEKTKSRAPEVTERSIGHVARVEPRPFERPKKAEALKVEQPEPQPEAETIPAEHDPSEIGENELPIVTRQVAEIRKELNKDLPPDPDTDGPAEELIDRVSNGEDMDVVHEDIARKLGVEIEPELEMTSENEPSEQVEEVPNDEWEDEILLHPTAEAEETETSVEDEPADPNPPAGSPPSGPPQRPTPPLQPGAGPGGFGGPGGGFNPNLAPPTPVAAPNRAPHVPEYQQASPAAMALFGGVIGYLIGRRRGRIKTEKKLLPIQKKLEKQVEDVQWQLQEKEASIRRLAAEQVAKQGPAALEAFTTKPKAEAKLTPSPVIQAEIAPAPQLNRVFERPIVAEQRQRAPEAHQLHGSQPTSEHIGQVLVAASEAAPAGRVERIEPKQQAEAVKLPEGKRIETLNRAELLAMSEKIKVEGGSLRQIYENNLIGEQGLRRLVHEHLRGGDLKRALRHEIVEREIDFERDPAVRDMATTAGGATGGGTAKTDKATLNKLIERAADSVPGSQEAAFFQARADHEATKLNQQQKHRRLIDISFVSIILILVGLLVLLVVSRG